LVVGWLSFTQNNNYGANKDKSQDKDGNYGLHFWVFNNFLSKVNCEIEVQEYTISVPFAFSITMQLLCKFTETTSNIFSTRPNDDFISTDLSIELCYFCRCLHYRIKYTNLNARLNLMAYHI